MVFALPVDPFCAVFESLSRHLLGPGIPEPHLKIINLAGDIPQELIKYSGRPASSRNQAQTPIWGGVKISYRF